MNKKFYLAALGVSMAFAACTEEELVSMPSVSLENREKIELEITANKSDIAQTRMTSEAGEGAGVFNFLWEKDIDKLGAAMADGTALGTVNNDDKVYVTYPFVANTSAVSSSFSGKSSIAQGLYFFHYPYTDHLGRTALDISVPEQEYDATSETTAMDQALKYMKMITPIVDLSTVRKGVTYEEAQKFSLPLTFEKLYKIVRIDISATNIDKDIVPEVQKVTLHAGGEVDADNFPRVATLDLDAFESESASFNDDKEFDEETFLANREALHLKIYDKTIYTVAKNEDRGDIRLDVKGVTLSNEGTKSLYVLVPKGNWGAATLEILTSEGTYTKEIATLDLGKTVETGDNKEDLYSKRDGIQPITANLDFNLDGSGNVVLPANFDIERNEDWTNAVEFVKGHALGYLNYPISFTLKNNVEIDALPTFALEILDGGDYTLTIAGNYTVNDRNHDYFKAENVDLKVKKGATLTLGHDYTSFASIVNEGTLLVNAGQTQSINNYGTMTVGADVNLSKAVINGRLENEGEGVTAMEGTITVAKGKELTATINNVNGTINLEAGVAGDTPDYTVWNLNGGSENSGTLNINAAAKVTGSYTVENKGKINHAGILEANVTNNVDKVINIKKGAMGNGTVAISGDGKIVVEDIIDYANVMANDNQKYTISNNIVTAVVNTYAEYAKANAQASKLTYITLAEGDWAYVETVADADKDKKLFNAPIDGIQGLEYKGGTLTLGGSSNALNADFEFTGKDATIVCPVDQDNEINESTLNGSIKNSVALTVSNGVTVNSCDAQNAKEATLNGNLTVKSGAKMYFSKAIVAKNMSLTVEGQVNEADKEEMISNAGEFGVDIDSNKQNFKNYGIVESKDPTGKVSVPANAVGKVSQPYNYSGATFKGNAYEGFLFENN